MTCCNNKIKEIFTQIECVILKNLICHIYKFYTESFIKETIEIQFISVMKGQLGIFCINIKNVIIYIFLSFSFVGKMIFITFTRNPVCVLRY